MFLEQRLLQKQAVYRTVSCPDLEKGVQYTPQGIKANSTNDISSESEDALGTKLVLQPLLKRRLKQVNYRKRLH